LSEPQGGTKQGPPADIKFQHPDPRWLQIGSQTPTHRKSGVTEFRVMYRGVPSTETHSAFPMPSRSRPSKDLGDGDRILNQPQCSRRPPRTHAGSSTPIRVLGDARSEIADPGPSVSPLFEEGRRARVEAFPGVDRPDPILTTPPVKSRDEVVRRTSELGGSGCGIALSSMASLTSHVRSAGCRGRR
jgi:hypothetical protein